MEDPVLSARDEKVKMTHAIIKQYRSGANSKQIIKIITVF
jgi:hypothetical protein